MKAILLSKENRELILAEGTPISPINLDAMIGEYSPRPAGMRLYFCPAFEDEADHWATIPEEFLDDNFLYDAEKIQTEFVDLTEKAVSL